MRYGGEFEALLIDLPGSPAVIADVAQSVVASRRGPLVFGFTILALALTIFFSYPKHKTTLAGAKPAGPPAPVACVLFAKHLPWHTPCDLG